MAKKGMSIDIDQKNKSTALLQAVGQIEKQHGKGSIMRLGTASLEVNIPVIPTGSLALDVALGVADFRKAVSSRFTVRNRREKPPSRSMRSPTRRNRVVLPY